MKRTTIEMGLAILRGKDLPWEYWSEAMNSAIHICNRIETVVVEGKTLYGAYYGKKLVITHSRIFGFDAYVHVHKDTHTKLDSHSRKCIFISYSEESKAYRVKKQVMISRDVVFKELAPPAAKEIQEIPALPLRRKIS